MERLLWVFAGGGLGAVARYLMTEAIQVRAAGNFPYGTLSVNLVGALAMGLLVGMTLLRESGDTLRLALGVGLLGGFTTYSAFSLDAVRLLESRAWSAFGMYVLGTGIGSILLCALGLFAGRLLVGQFVKP